MLTSGGIFNLFEGVSPFRDGRDVLDESVAEIGALYGRMRVARAFATFVAFGLAYTEVLPAPLTPIDQSVAPTLGVPFRLGASWRPTRVFGVGVRAFGNLNLEEPTYGAALAVELGRLVR